MAGTIALKRPLAIRNPFVTLAGQSAPGDGICLRDYVTTVGGPSNRLYFAGSVLEAEGGLLTNAGELVSWRATPTWKSA